MEFSSHEKGLVTIYRPPTDDGLYVVGADVAEGLAEGDYSCAQVLDYHRLEQVAVFHGHVPPDVFAYRLCDLGAFYNWAYTAVEFNGPGAVTLNRLHKDLNYPHLYWRQRLETLSEKISPDRPGFVTSARTKPIILRELDTLLRDHEIVLHDKETVREIQQYQCDETRSGRERYGAPDGKFDDRVMALAIACEAQRQFVPMPGQTRRTWEQLTEFYDIPGVVENEEYGEDPGPGWGES